MDTLEGPNDNDDETDAPATPVTREEVGDGVFAELGALSASTVVNEGALARIFNRHPSSIKKAVERGELPAPARLFGGNAWTAGAIVRHVEKRLEAAAKEAGRKERIIQKYSV